MTELNDIKKMQDAVRNILVGIGEDPDRAGLSANFVPGITWIWILWSMELFLRNTVTV